MKTTPFFVSRKNRKDKSETLDLKEMVAEIILLSQRELQITLKFVQGKTLRPHEIISSVFDIPREMLTTAKVIKTDKKYKL